MVFKNQDNTQNEKYLTYDQMNIIISFEKLWVRFAMWIRSYLRALIYDTRNLNLNTNMINSLPTEVYNLFSIFFGTEIAENMRNLFFQFFQAMMQVAEAMKYGDKILTDARIIKWYQAADAISSYLARINVYWDENQWKYLIYEYIRLKTDEINAIIQGNDAAEEELYNLIENVNFLMSNYMARGVIHAAQNPNHTNP